MLPLLGMEHPFKHHRANRGNLGNAEKPDSQDTSIYMLVSSHSSVLNLLHSSAHRSAPIQTPTPISFSGGGKSFISCVAVAPVLSCFSCFLHSYKHSYGAIVLGKAGCCEVQDCNFVLYKSLYFQIASLAIAAETTEYTFRPHRHVSWTLTPQ